MATQLALKDSTGSDLVQLSDTARMIEVIARAARDETISVEKMERLEAMYERMEAREAKKAFTNAMAAMKPKLPIIDRKGRIEVREKTASGKRDGDIQQSTGFARWEDIDEAITPILHEHGFTLTFRSGVAADGKIAITGILDHVAGHREETTLPLPHDSTGSKNAVQAIGSSLSYGKRYTATFLLNIRTKGDDDDGEKAPGGFVTEAQLEHIFRLLKDTKSDTTAFCRFMGVESVPDIKASDFDKAMTTLNLKLSNMKKKDA